MPRSILKDPPMHQQPVLTAYVSVPILCSPIVCTSEKHYLMIRNSSQNILSGKALDIMLWIRHITHTMFSLQDPSMTASQFKIHVDNFVWLLKSHCKQTDKVDLHWSTGKAQAMVCTLVSDEREHWQIASCRVLQTTYCHRLQILWLARESIKSCQSHPLTEVTWTVPGQEQNNLENLSQWNHLIGAPLT